MTKSKIFMTGFSYKQNVSIILAVIAFAALSGCSVIGAFDTAPKNPVFDGGPKLVKQNLPTYVVGESFTYSDGRTDTVLELNGDTVVWRDDRGVLRTKYRNFLLPDVSWQNRTRRSVSTVTATPGMLWPLAIGNDQKFDYWQTVAANNGSSTNDYKQSWQCVVERTEKLTVEAGVFDVFKIPCYRYIIGTSNFRQRRTFYYAPSVGHYIKRTDTYVSRSSAQRRLVSLGYNSTVLPTSDQSILNRTLQDALNNNPDGIGANWTSGDGNVTATLTPEKSYRDEKGATCREYSSVYTVQGRKRGNKRNVCRQANGLWQRVR